MSLAAIRATHLKGMLADACRGLLTVPVDICKRAFLTLLVLLITGCNSAEPQQRAQAPVENLVGEVALLESVTEQDHAFLLDVGVRVFETAPVNPSTAQVAPWLVEEIRVKETHYLPYVLRNTLISSNQWGAVRVLPAEDPSVDLQIIGRVVHSDGLNLVLGVRAWDSTGRIWLDRTYSDESSNRDYVQNTLYSGENAGTAIDPFADLFARVANDLLTVREGLTTGQLGTVKQVSEMAYARDLAPATFGSALASDETGLLRVTRQLADNDPMLDRLYAMRVRHLAFIDTLDVYYGSLHDEMQPLYDLWRSYSRDQILETRERIPGSRDGNAGSGITALTQSYNRYKWARIYEQEFAGLAQGFNNEIAPAILELNRRVHGLTGSVEEQYEQWREILRELFELDTGVQLPAPL